MRGDLSVTWITLLVIALIISILIARSNSRDAANEKANRIKAQNKSRQKDSELSEARQAHTKQLTAVELQYKKLLEHMRGLDRIFGERKIQFPWLATAIADFHALEAERDAKMLESKKHPAVRAAAEVREHGSKRREAERLARQMRYRAEYYEKLFPWLADYVGDDVPDFAVEVGGTTETSDDPVRIWLTEAEYKNLSIIEKNQMALERWKTKKRSNWEIGREYERFIGYNYRVSWVRCDIYWSNSWIRGYGSRSHCAARFGITSDPMQVLVTRENNS